MPVTVDFTFKGKSRRATRKKLNRVSDGDTPVIEQPIRMVSCDTPEKAEYAGKPNKSQPKLDKCKQRLENGHYNAIPKELRDYFIQKLTPDAAQKHIDAGNDATDEFNRVLEGRLTRDNGSKRGVAVMPSGEFIDTYGRLLAYIAPWFSGSASDPLPPRDSPERRTFNLEMIETGWAAIFPIYPSLPRKDDFNMAIKAAEEAWDNQKGIWEKYGRDVLLAYEFRACIKLGTAENGADKAIKNAFQRVCVDLRNLNVLDEFGFHQVPPPHRMWIWKDDIEEATQALGL